LLLQHQQQVERQLPLPQQDAREANTALLYNIPRNFRIVDDDEDDDHDEESLVIDDDEPAPEPQQMETEVN